VEDDRAGEGEEGRRCERGRPAEPGPRRPVDEGHRGRAECRLQHLGGEERPPKGENQGEEVDVERGDEEGLATGGCAEEQVASRHLPGERDVDAESSWPTGCNRGWS